MIPGLLTRDARCCQMSYPSVGADLKRVGTSRGPTASPRRKTVRILKVRVGCIACFVYCTHT